MDPIQHLKSHLSREYVERLSGIALASAGFSAGLLALLAQADFSSLHTNVSLWSSVTALMLSLYGWQYFLPYLLHGEKTFGHINLVRVALLQVSTVIALLVSVTALVWRLSCWAGLAMVLSGICLAVLVIRHNSAVIRHCQESGT